MNTHTKQLEVRFVCVCVGGGYGAYRHFKQFFSYIIDLKKNNN
jgi:hypothetical protein